MAWRAHLAPRRPRRRRCAGAITYGARASSRDKRAGRLRSRFPRRRSRDLGSRCLAAGARARCASALLQRAEPPPRKASVARRRRLQRRCAGTFPRRAPTRPSPSGGAMGLRQLLPLLALLALTPAVAPQSNKCGGLCRCQQLTPEDPDEGFGVLVNCSDASADAGGAVPVPSDAALEAALRGAAFARMSFARCGAERLLPLEAPAGVPLRALDLSDNALSALLDQVLNRVRADLRVLRLDGNRLQELNGDTLRPLRALRVLDVSRNSLKALDLGALPTTLLRLRARANRVEELHAQPLGADALELQELDLSHNALETLDRGALKSLPHLTVLRLAGNPLDRLDGGALGALPRLQTLDVSHCGLTAVSLEKHGALLRLDASNNSLTAEQAALLAPALPSLQALDLSGNPLQAFPVQEAHLALQVLNVSNNGLSALPDPPPSLPLLAVLDVSRNVLRALPETLGAPALPALRRLLLDGNAPLAELRLAAPLPRLRELSARDLPSLRVVAAGALDGLRADAPPSCALKEGDEPPGLALRLARNEQLAQVDSGAFDGLPLCELDLSGCALTSLPESAAPWEQLRVVNLQGNPMDCSCSMQWLVDRVVKPLYDSDRRQLLYELRCGTPAQLRGRRLVHFYDWQGALCSPRETLQRLQAQEPEPAEQHYNLSAGRGMLIALCSVGVIFLGTVIAGLLMHHQMVQRRRRQNRRI